MAEVWLFVFLFRGALHAAGLPMTLEECTERATASSLPALCVRSDRPRAQIQINPGPRGAEGSAS